MTKDQERLVKLVKAQESPGDFAFKEIERLDERVDTVDSKIDVTKTDLEEQIKTISLTPGKDGESIKGEKGDKGDKGDVGKIGKDGKSGKDGKKGDKGENGKDGKKGDDGKDGIDGLNGEKGDKPDHKWDGTYLAFEKPDGSWGKFVNLIGKSGRNGKAGASWSIVGGGGSTVDLSSYVPYTGATGNVDLGVYSLTAAGIVAFGDADNYFALSSAGFQQYSNGSLASSLSDDGWINLDGYGGRSIRLGTSDNYVRLSNQTYAANLLLSSLTDDRTFTFPNASGTIALTSNLSSYLPLAGGTISGNLIVAATEGAEQMPALTTGNWTLGTGWAYQTSPNRVSKTANGTGTATTTAATTIVTGTTYKVVITVDSISGGTVAVNLGGFTGFTIYNAGTHTFYVTAISTGKIIFTPSVTGVRIAMSAISVKPLTDATGDLDVQGNARFFSPITNPLIVSTTDKGPSVIFNAYNNNTGERLFDFTRNWVPYLSSDQYGGVKIGNSNSTGQFTVDPGWFNGSGNFAALSKFTNSNTGTGAGHQVQIATLGGGNVGLLLSAASIDRLIGVDQSDGLNMLKISMQNSHNSVNDPFWLRQDAYTANGARLSIGNNPGNKTITASNGDIEAWAEGSTIGANLLTNGTFTGSAAGWTTAGGFAYDTNNIRYTHSGGTGTLTQAYTDFAITCKGGHWYKLKYTIGSHVAGYTITIPGFQVVALQARKFNRSGNGTSTYYIKALNGTTNFQIAVASTAGGFTIDDISLEEMQNGDVIANGSLMVRDGDNATLGSATLVAGTVTVNTNKVTANSRIFLTNGVTGGTVGFLSVGTLTAGTSFVINSSSVLDTSTINWFIVEPLI